MTDQNNEDVTPSDDVVNPWEVQSSSATGVDYDKLISKITQKNNQKEWVETLSTNNYWYHYQYCESHLIHFFGS